MQKKSYFLIVYSWLIVKCLTPFSTVFQLYRGGHCTYQCFPGVILSSPHNILSKPLAAFPHNHYGNNGQRWERNEYCHNDQSSETILAKPGIEPATPCSQVFNATDWTMQARHFYLFLKMLPLQSCHPLFVPYLKTIPFCGSEWFWPSGSITTCNWIQTIFRIKFACCILGRLIRKIPKKCT